MTLESLKEFRKKNFKVKVEINHDGIFDNEIEISITNTGNTWNSMSVTSRTI